MLRGYWLVAGSCLSVSQMGHMYWGLRLMLMVTVTLAFLGGSTLPKVIFSEELLSDLLSGGAVANPVVVVGFLDKGDRREGRGCVLGPSELVVVCNEEAPASDH